MSNQWFRLYNEFSTDPKVQSMSEAMQRRLVMLFCLQSGDVTVTLHDDELAFALRISEEELAETKVLFLRKGFIDDDWCIVNWDKRQYSSDSSAERTRAYRERKKKAHVTAGDVTVTPPDTDSDTDTEVKENTLSGVKENSPPGESPSPDLKKSGKRQTKTKLPEDFIPPDEWGDYAVSKGFSPGEVAEMWQRFRAHHLANGSVFLSWRMAWQTWVLRQLEINQRARK